MLKWGLEQNVEPFFFLTALSHIIMFIVEIKYSLFRQ